MPVSSMLPFTVTGRSYPIDAEGYSLSILLLWWGMGAGRSGWGDDGTQTSRRQLRVVDRQADSRGDRTRRVRHLPGAGKPLPGHNEPYDGEWWLRDYLRREGAPTDELLPTPLRLRKVIGQLPETVRALRTEQAVRDAVAEVNDQVRAWWRSSVGHSCTSAWRTSKRSSPAGTRHVRRPPNRPRQRPIQRHVDAGGAAPLAARHRTVHIGLRHLLRTHIRHESRSSSRISSWSIAASHTRTQL